MRQSSLVLLAAVAGLLVLFGVFSAQQRQATDSLADVREAVFPDLKASLADLTRVTIQAAGNEVILDAVRSGDGWVASNKGGYTVETEKLRVLLQDVADAHFQEAKTSKADQYHHLGLRDVADAESKARKVSLEREGKPTLELLVGNKAAGWKASYARLADEPQSWVLDREIVIAKEAVDWLPQQVLDISLERVRSVAHTAPDGEKLWIEKPSPEAELFDVADIPEGRLLSYESVPEVVADVIENLRLEDVTTAADFTWEDDQTYTAEFRTFDGLVIESRALARDEEHFVAFQVRYDAASRWVPSVEESAAEAGDSSEPTAEEAPEEEQTEEDREDAQDAADELNEQLADAGLRSEDEVREEAEALNARLAPWVFRIAEYRFKGFIKRTSELLKVDEPEKEEAPSTDASNASAIPHG